MSASRRWSAGLAAVLVLVAPAAGAPPAMAAPGGTPLFSFSDPRIDEASGIARGLRSPGVYYVHNDSGDSARFFAVDARTGRTLATYSVPGATNVDWEDLAVARDARGVPSIWIADIGDNDSARTEVRVYRVDEPAVDLSGTGAQLQTAAPQVWRLRYPDGAQNAESLAVAPGGAMFLFDKVVLGETQAYAVPMTPGPGVQTVTPIGGFDTVDTGTAGGPNVFGRLTATGAAISADGTILAVRTYTDAYLWRLGAGAGAVKAALSRAPVHVPLPAQPQGEGITVDGNRLVIDSEKVGSTVYSVPIPALPPAPAGSPGTKNSTAGARKEASSSATADGASSTRPGAGERGSSNTGDRVVIALAALVVLGAGIAGVRAARRGRRR